MGQPKENKDKEQEPPNKPLEFPDPNQLINYQILVRRGRQLMREKGKAAKKEH